MLRFYIRQDYGALAPAQQGAKEGMVQATFSISSTIPTDEATALMSNTALGCYVKLMCLAWREGSIPADLERIARLCGENVINMRHLWTQIAPCFEEDVFKPGRLIHVQLEEQRTAANALRSAKSAAGALGAQRRWGQRSAAQLAGKTVAATSVGISPPAPSTAAPATAAVPLHAPATSIPGVLADAELTPHGDGNGDLFGAPIVVPATSKTIPPCPQSEIIALYHELLPTCPRVLTWTGTRETQLRSRWREMAITKNAQLGGYSTQADGLEWWRRFFSHCAKSAFLTGQTQPRPGHPQFTASLEWIVGPKNFAKILEGNYHREQA